MQIARAYQIIVGNDVKAFAGNASSQGKDESNATILDQLQFTTSIQIDNDFSKNQSDDVTFDIINLSKEFEQAFKSDGATLMLRAGYYQDEKRLADGSLYVDNDDLPVIFLGTIYHSFSYKQGQDEITRVFVSTDKVERATTKDSLSFSPGSKLSEIISDLAKRMPFTVNKIDFGNVGGKVYVGGLSLYGKVANMLTRVCDENGLTWFVHNKKLTVQPIRPVKDSAQTPWDIHPADMIESVKATYTRSRTKVGKKSKGEELKPGEKVTVADGMKTVIKSGVTVTVLLDGRLMVGDFVRLNDIGDLAGDYRINSIRHQLSYRQGDWTTELECVAV
ncbi:hypothetical protein K6R49_003724 [Escherichia coli]|nr:hypothetical protein [Escherichia coli]MBJ0329692.1 hypothetical protein [Escherichia coli]